MYYNCASEVVDNLHLISFFLFRDCFSNVDL